MTDGERLIYLAGLFDGEGSFSIQVNIRRCNSKSGRKSVLLNPRMSVQMKESHGALAEFERLFGGMIYAPRASWGMEQWMLCQRAKLVAAATVLRPYLLVKQGIADRFLEALSLYPGRDDASRWRGERRWTEDMVLRVAEIALTLNPCSARKSKRTLDYMNEIRQMYTEDAA